MFCTSGCAYSVSKITDCGERVIVREAVSVNEEGVVEMEALLAETKNLTKKFGEQIAVNKVCLHLKKGRTYGLIGRNGSGKTTIMKMILGLTKKMMGKLLFLVSQWTAIVKIFMARLEV